MVSSCRRVTPAGLLLAALLLGGCAVAQERPLTRSDAPALAVIGSTSLPADLLAAAPTVAPHTAQTVMAGRTPPAVTPLFLFGAAAEVASADDRGVALRADAGEAAGLLSRLRDGDLVTILPPSGDYDDYPVMRDEAGWVRLRTVDGLVGWARVDQIEMAGEP